MTWKQQYQQAHEADFKQRYPTAYTDGHYCQPNYPDPKSTNGLTRIIQNFLTWSGHYANRINVYGRQIGGFTRTESGVVFDDRRWIKSSTKKGTADLICSINGRMVSIEIKNEYTRDRVSKDQTKDRDRVGRSGAVYVVITNVDQFFLWHEQYINRKFELSNTNLWPGKKPM